MDGLTEEERAIAWKSYWSTSFAGSAIIGRDGTIRAANPQFYKILDVTPADILGKTLQEITILRDQRLDMENAEHVAAGRIASYVMHKTCEIQGRRIRLVNLVVRVPTDTTQPFLFFLSRIMRDETPLPTASINAAKSAPSPTPFPKQIDLFIKNWWKWLVGLGVVLGSMFVHIFGGKQ